MRLGCDTGGCCTGVSGCTAGAGTTAGPERRAGEGAGAVCAPVVPPPPAPDIGVLAFTCTALTPPVLPAGAVPGDGTVGVLALPALVRTIVFGG